MNQAQFESLVKDFGKYLALLIVAHGWLDDATAQMVVGGLGMIALSAWSYWKHRTASMISAVAKSPQVAQVVVVDPAVARADPSPKVVAQ